MTKYQVLFSTNQHDLIKKVNESIEQGFIPVGRMFKDSIDYKQTVVHRSVYEGLGKAFSEAVAEGRK